MCSSPVFNPLACPDNTQKGQDLRKIDMAVSLVQDLGVACALLTRLPLPGLPNAAFARQARATWAFPIVGALVGLIAAAAGLAALGFGLPAAVAAGVVLGAQIIVTGAMHEDGLADTVDGLWGGWTRARRLEIMKDSAIGTYGVLALLLSVGLRWTALATLLPLGGEAVIAAAILSRAVLSPIMAALPHARSEGLSHRIGRPDRHAVAACLLIAVALGWALIGPVIIGALFCASLPVALIAIIARARIGGQTGDILGAAQQLAEIGILLGLLGLS